MILMGDPKMKRVLITGGAGFIAHHLIGQILKTKSNNLYKK